MPKQAAISKAQRRVLRIYAAQHPHQRQYQLKDWFEAEFQCTITQSSIPESLSNKYEHLDTLLRPQELQQAISISADLIKQKSVHFWIHLDYYQGIEVPKFSNRWLDVFKIRHRIKARARHEEASSINEADIAEQLVPAQAIARLYEPQDIYNCDKTELLWKMTPDRGFATQQIADKKKS